MGVVPVYIFEIQTPHSCICTWGLLFRHNFGSGVVCLDAWVAVLGRVVAQAQAAVFLDTGHVANSHFARPIRTGWEREPQMVEVSPLRSAHSRRALLAQILSHSY